MKIQEWIYQQQKFYGKSYERTYELLLDTFEKLELRHLKKIVRFGHGESVLIQNINNLFDKLIKYYDCKRIDKLSDTKKAQALLLLIGGDNYGD